MDGPDQYFCTMSSLYPLQRATYYRTEDSNGGGVPGCNRPKVRLRARKVLCHNCKEVCNDRGENLQQQYQAGGGGGGIKPGDVRYVLMIMFYVCKDCT